MLDKLSVWFKAIRVPFFTASIIPVMLGSAAAWHQISSFNWFKFWLTMLGIVLIHAGTNLANDYFDHASGCDTANKTPTSFSGGSRVIQQGLIKPKKILFVSLVLFALGAVIGLFLNYLSGRNVILILGAIGVFLGFFYTAKPFQIGYGGFGEISVGLGFGPLIVLGSYFVQAQKLSPNIFLISIPIGILITLVLLINEFPDYSADKSAGKRTLVVILGKKRAVMLYHILLTSVYLSIAFLVIFNLIPLFCLIVFLTLPLSLKIFLVSKKNFDKIYEILPVNANTIKLHSFIGVLLCVGFALDKLF